MAKSNKPIVWGPFAAGGTLTAFLTPALMLLTLLAALGHAPDLFSYETMRAFAGHWLVKAAIAVVVFAGYILYDVSAIIHGGETNYVMATLRIYIDLYNLFVNLLNLLLAFAGNRD